MKEYDIILFYKYVRVEDPQALRDAQKALCKKLGLTGRVIVAHEGVNATLEGRKEAVSVYLKEFLADPRFADTHIKRSSGTGQSFPRLSVKLRPEIVSLKLKDDIDPNVTTGKHLPPEELHAWMRDKERDFVIVDMRNDYEHKVGHFKGSVLPPLSDFRDLPKVLPKLAHLKDKKVITVCTGGVRCEKASGLLVREGFKDVYQLDGGIVSYMEKFHNDDFQGKLYVFDGRVSMAFADEGTRGVVGKCHSCDGASERYVNCQNDLCHNHLVVCEDCEKKEGAYCGFLCKHIPTQAILKARKKAKWHLKMFRHKIKKIAYLIAMKLRYGKLLGFRR